VGQELEVLMQADWRLQLMEEPENRIKENDEMKK
jgi:hypothetical protein